MIAAAPVRRRLTGIGAAVAVAGLIVTGCSSSSSPEPSADAVAVDVVLTPEGCQPSPASAPAGLVTFNITNKDATAVSEAELMRDTTVLGEKENLTPGLSGSFSVRLEPGKYTVLCPNAKAPRADFAITGAAS